MVTKKSPAKKPAKKVAKAKPAKAPKVTVPKKLEAEKRISGLTAAAMVLEGSTEPMTAKQMIEAMEAQGLWKSPKGKTPQASLNAAIHREIAAKGADSRFKKTGPGLFTHA